MDSLLGGILLVTLAHCIFGGLWDRAYNALFGGRWGNDS